MLTTAENKKETAFASGRVLNTSGIFVVVGENNLWEDFLSKDQFVH